MYKFVVYSVLTVTRGIVEEYLVYSRGQIKLNTYTKETEAAQVFGTFKLLGVIQGHVSYVCICIHFYPRYSSEKHVKLEKKYKQ